jgi:fructoselysine-6-P-deglycase FrlB-like protein
MGGRKEESSFCEQKEAKKLYSFGAGSSHHAAPSHKSFFASFFSKKEDSSLN